MASEWDPNCSFEVSERGEPLKLVIFLIFEYSFVFSQ